MCIFYRALHLRRESTSRVVPSHGQALGLHGLLKVVRWSLPLTIFHILWNMTSSFAMSFRQITCLPTGFIGYSKCVMGIIMCIYVFLKMQRDWEEVRVMVIRPGPIPTSSPCGNTIPADDLLTVSLPSGARSVKHMYKCLKGQSIQVSTLTFCHHLLILMLFFCSSVEHNERYFEELFLPI